MTFKILLIAMMGEPLDDAERVIFKELTGRDREPLQRVEGAFVADCTDQRSTSDASKEYRGDVQTFVRDVVDYSRQKDLHEWQRDRPRQLFW
jgi:hypothetical protein